MTYPSKIMKTSALIKECGFTRKYLMRMAHIKGQNYVRKLPGGRDFYWDTEKFEKDRVRLGDK